MIHGIAAILQSATPLIYATLAGVLAQRAGIWHLGLEGLLVASACASAVVTKQTSSVAAGMLAAAIVCVFASLMLWLAIEKLKANPIIAGLGLTGIGLSGSDLLIQAVYGNEASVHVPEGLPRLAASAGDFGGLSVLVFAMPLVVFVVWAILRRSRLGLQIAASGEHPFAARSVGIRPSRMRLLALAAGGLLCSFGGTELALGSLKTFTIGMAGGRGFMAFAAVIFGASDPVFSALTATFFTMVEYFGIEAQASLKSGIPTELILALPYVATIFAIWLAAYLRGAAASLASASELKDY